MPVSLGSKGQPDFTQPIELMMDCHRRIEHFLLVLRKVLDRYGDIPLDIEAQAALETALNYFHQAAPRHTADEEQSLFPRMRQCDDPSVHQALAELDHLESDHRKAEIAHAQVEVLGRQWLSNNTIDARSRALFQITLDDLSQTYAQHIQLEDQTVFVLASHTLPSAELMAVGREMKQRRSDDPGRVGSRCAQRRIQTQQADHCPSFSTPVSGQPE